jgi:hypothetical protein
MSDTPTEPTWPDPQPDPDEEPAEDWAKDDDPHTVPDDPEAG